jgi:regulation of enolase protein 1 (concanavalin A-like superfamily)
MNKAAGMEDRDGEITIAAPARTDFFNDPVTGKRVANAPFYYRILSGSFLVRCEIRPGFTGTYDAGALMVYDSPERWVKLCLEKTDLGDTACVSVVTNGSSDDANGEIVRDASVHLQIVRAGDALCLHHSRDGREWRMVRMFSLPMDGEVKAGIVAQSPVGEGCTVRFTGFSAGPNPYANIRSAV